MLPNDFTHHMHHMQPDLIREHDKHIINGDAFIVTNHLFGESLYSWWIIEVSRYEPGDIDGVLMDDIRAGIHGPFATKPDAMHALGLFR